MLGTWKLGTFVGSGIIQFAKRRFWIDFRYISPSSESRRDFFTHTKLEYQRGKFFKQIYKKYTAQS